MSMSTDEGTPTIDKILRDEERIGIKDVISTISLLEEQRS
jgi:hypothetical protein